MIPVIIQARMSSSRLPGKVLKKINGIPILAHIVDRCSQAVGKNYVVVATSSEKSDDPIEIFTKQLGVTCYRGSLNNVYLRFVDIIKILCVQHFVRVSADSPFLDPNLIQAALKQAERNDVDLITNIFPRRYPKGQSVELIRASGFLEPSYQLLQKFSAEHITRGFYLHAEQFDIINFSCKSGVNNGLSNWAIDTIDDFKLVNDWAKVNPEIQPIFQVEKITLYKKGFDNA